MILLDDNEMIGVPSTARRDEGGGWMWMEMEVVVVDRRTPFHGVPRGILKLEIFYFFVEPRHFSVRHR